MYSPFIFLVVLGCGGKKITDEKIEGKVIIEIVRPVAMYGDPELYIAAQNAFIDGNSLIIEGLVSIRGDIGTGWIVEMMEIKDNKMIIPIPRDPKYRITITKKD